MPDKAEFLRGVKRVLKPGGHFLFNVWDRLEENSCARIYAQVLEEMFPGDPDVHFNLPYHMHDREALRALRRALGSRFRCNVFQQRGTIGAVLRERFGQAIRL